MIVKPETIDDLVVLIQANFPTFGGIKTGNRSNPLTHWEEGNPATFALGVDVRQIATFVLAHSKEIQKKRPAGRPTKPCRSKSRSRPN